jgi:hypothetical protein
LQDIDITMTMTSTPRSAEVAAAQAASSIATTRVGDTAISIQPKESDGSSSSGDAASHQSAAGSEQQHEAPDLSAMLPEDDAMVYGGEW